jgi:ParB family transcriptional regulator, chromosome partitioning protein
MAQETATVPPAESPPAKVDESPLGFATQELPLSQIREGRNARVLQSAPEQRALTESVKEHGILQPIRVRPMGDGMYEVIAGHRRFAAAKSAHLKTAPAVVAIVTDETTAFVQSLVENLQREDLNPLDEARALKALIAEKTAHDPEEATQEKIGKLISRSQAYVSNSMRLLDLEEPVQEAIQKGQLSASHGKALAALPAESQVQVAREAIAKKLPSREVEDRIKRAKEEAQRVAETKDRRTTEAANATTKLVEFLAATKKLKAADVEIVSPRYGTEHLIAAFVAAGVKSRGSGPIDHVGPEWDCAEQKTTFTYQQWTGAFTPTCTVQQHHDEFVKDRDKAKQKAAAKISQALERAKTATGRAMRSDEGKGILNAAGQRVALFAFLTSHRGYSYGSGNGRSEAFVKRHGGVREGVSDVLPMDILETIEGLDEKDLGQELAAAVLDGVFVNVWSETARYGDDWSLRQYLVDHVKGLDAALVWGDRPVPRNVVEQLVQRGKPITADQQADLDRVKAERDAYAERFTSVGRPANATTAAAEAQVAPEPDDEPDDGVDDGEDVEEK